ncbi:hypothetical protein BV87_16115 [Sphingobium yanoikuyae]|uniref:Uncharacterized protein n=1 Tax=Sphingobium yanoikuyae TaxID=13690 RepID=A0A0J9D3R3_SPHYA|nr:hypothetical protein BV87_16115 [Sphingobium yanoikuyae]KMW31963.1 hypothetical protein BV87_20940 [Sphingobium yanoikuyae]
MSMRELQRIAATTASANVSEPFFGLSSVTLSLLELGKFGDAQRHSFLHLAVSRWCRVCWGAGRADGVMFALC